MPLKPSQKRGKRLTQNRIKIQQLKNKQFVLTLPQIWAEILNAKKGSIVKFIPGKQGGIEIIKADKEDTNTRENNTREEPW